MLQVWDWITKHFLSFCLALFYDFGRNYSVSCVLYSQDPASTVQECDGSKTKLRLLLKGVSSEAVIIPIPETVFENFKESSPKNRFRQPI